MPICRIYLCTCGDRIDENNITSIKVMRKANWPALKQIDTSKRMNKVGNNSFGDAESLSLGCFPEMLQFFVYTPWKKDTNNFTEQCFSAKMQAASLKKLCTSSLM
jgi:hypothetical protein